MMNSSSSQAFGIRAFGVTIRVESESAETRDILDRFLLPPLPRCEVSSVQADITLRVRESSGALHVFLNGVNASSAETPQDCALAAVKALDDALVQRLKGLRAVHAGAVVLHGKALLIPGLSHAGKSSLVAELLRCGASHLSDEYALVDEEGRVHAYPRPLLLRNGSPRQSLVLPQELNATFKMEPVSVGWIVAVDYTSGATWDIHEISQGEAVMLLLRNTPHEMGQSPEMINLFTRSAAGAKCYAGMRGDVVEAAARVLDLVSKK